MSSILYTGPYNIAKAGLGVAAEFIHHNAGPVINGIGSGINYVFDDNRVVLTTSLIAGAIFALGVKNGWTMFKSPYSNSAKWIRVEDRFESKVEMKGNLVNLSKLLNEVVLPDQVSSLAKTTAEKAKKDSETAKTKMETTKTQAEEALARFNAALLIATDSRREATDADTAATDLEGRLNQTRVQRQEAGTARRLATKCAENANRNEAEAARLKIEADGTKATADNAKKESENATEHAKTAENLATPSVTEQKKQAEAKEKAKEKGNDYKDVSVGSYLINYNVEKTKKKEGEFHLNLPLSNDALIITPAEFKKHLSSSVAGGVMFGTSALGFVDAALDVSNYFEFTKDSHLSTPFSYIGATAGTTLQGVIYAAGKTAGFVTSLNKLGYGIGNVGASVGLAYLGYNIINPPKNDYFDGVSLKWINYKELIGFNLNLPLAPLGMLFPQYIKRPNIFNKVVIAKDLTKMFVASSLIAGSVLSANEFLSGN